VGRGCGGRGAGKGSTTKENIDLWQRLRKAWNLCDPHAAPLTTAANVHQSEDWGLKTEESTLKTEDWVLEIEERRRPPKTKMKMKTAKKTKTKLLRSSRRISFLAINPWLIYVLHNRYKSQTFTFTEWTSVCSLILVSV